MLRFETGFATTALSKQAESLQPKENGFAIGLRSRKFVSLQKKNQ